MIKFLSKPYFVALLTILLVGNVQTFSQDKVELGLFIGSSSYMGDLNPQNPVYQPNLSGGVVGRYVYTDRIALRMTGMLTSLRGSYPDNGVYMPRVSGSNYLPDSISSYSFNRPLVGDISAQVEFNFISYDHAFISNTSFTPFVAIGLGSTVYKRFVEQGTKPVDKTVFVLSLPLTFGFKYKVNKHMRVGVEWTFRKLFASDIDQTSANSVITPSDPYGFNQQSAIINNDWISTIGATVTFNMWPRKLGCSAGYRDLK